MILTPEIPRQEAIEQRQILLDDETVHAYIIPRGKRSTGRLITDKETLDTMLDLLFVNIKQPNVNLADILLSLSNALPDLNLDQTELIVHDTFTNPTAQFSMPNLSLKAELSSSIQAQIELRTESMPDPLPV